jgi:hypothetical protein
MDSHCCVYTGNLGTYLITLSEFCIDKETENTNHKEHNKPRYLNCGFLSCDTMHSHKKRPNFGELATFIFRVKVNVLRLCQKTASYCKTMASTYKITLCDNLDNHNLNAKSYIHMLCYNKTGTKHKKCRQFCYHFCLLYVLCTCRNHYQMYNTLKLYIQQNKANTSRLRNQKSEVRSQTESLDLVTTVLWGLGILLRAKSNHKQDLHLSPQCYVTLKSSNFIQMC